LQFRFIKQTISNACGTIGVLHALANNEKLFGLKPDCPLLKFLANVQQLSPIQRAKKYAFLHSHLLNFYSLEEASDLAAAHEEVAQQGQTAAPSLDDDIYNHFIAFVEKEGNLYELYP
jgi:ubiquitin carboxyl-terminal hydrolase L3